MKNIYEDGADRPPIEDVSSGAFDFSGDDPRPPRPAQPSPIRTNRPPDADPPQPEGTVQLTQKQLDQLVQQVLAAKEQPASSAQPQTQTPAKPGGDNSYGTKILYQSKDFDKEDNSIERPAPKKSLSSFLEADDSFMDGSVADPRFQVDEVDEDEGFYAHPRAAFASEKVLPESETQEEDIDESDTEPVDSNRHIGRMVVLVISLLAILVSGAILLREYKLHLDNKRFEEDVSDMILQTNEAISPNAPGNVENAVHLTEEQQWAQIKGEYPNTTFPKGLQLKYARLYATNNEFVGYLEAPGINMSLPVVQTTDDEAYLNKNFYGKSTKYGCPFVSYLNRINVLDYNTIIFGHHMNDHTIFGALDNYKTLAGYRKSPVIAFNTLYHDYSWKVFAVFITNAVPEDDNGYVFNYYFTNLISGEDRASYLKELRQRSIYDTGVDVTVNDPLLTLSTCSHEFDNARLVVVARLVREGENPAVDTDRLTLNSNPRYPQVYYDKKKLNNPYAGAPRWVVG